MSSKPATIAEVKAALAAFETAASQDSTLEAAKGKRLAAAVEALTPRDDLTRIFNQIYGNALKDFLVNKEKKVPGYSSRLIK